MVPGDELIDLFPGTGIVTAAWREVSSSSTSTASPRAGATSPRDPVTPDPGDALLSSPAIATAVVKGSRDAVALDLHDGVTVD